jgi:hypothetical protein
VTDWPALQAIPQGQETGQQGERGKVLLPDLPHLPCTAVVPTFALALTAVILALDRFTIR